MQTINKELYGTLLLLWLGHFLVDFMIGIWPVYKTIAHLDLAKAGMITAACAFIGEGLQIVFGALSDRGYRSYLIMFGVLASASNCLLAYTDDYLLIFCLFLTVCIGSGAFHPSAVGLTGNLNIKRRAFLITIFTSGGSIGLAFSQIIYTHMHDYLGGNTCWMVLPFIALIAIIYCVGLYQLPGDASAKGKKIDLKEYWELFKHKDLRNLYFTQVCNQSVFWALVFLLPDILLYREYDHWIVFGGGHLFLILGGAFMMIPAGHLADKFSPRLVLLYGSSVGMVLLYIILLCPLLPPAIISSLLFAMGASIGMITPVLVSFGIKMMPSKPGTISAFLLGLAWCLSEGIGQGGGGLLTKLFEEDAPAKALLILGAMLPLGLWAAYRLPEKISEKNVEYAKADAV